MNKALERQLISWLKIQKKPAQFWIQTTIICGVFSTLLLLTQTGLIAYFLQTTLIEKVISSALWLPLTGLVTLSLLRGILTWAREYAGQRAGESVRQELRAELLETLQQAGPVWTQTKTSW